jgi:NAD+ synthase
MALPEWCPDGDPPVDDRSRARHDWLRQADRRARRHSSPSFDRKEHALGTDYTALADEIAGWLRYQRAAAGADRFVLGLSGGVDSATVCALCTMASGPASVLAVLMPSHSNPTDAEHAALVARTFEVPSVTVDLSSVTDALLAAIAEGVPAEARLSAAETVAGEWRPERAASLARANVRPRLRMATLYYLANLTNGIVVGTGNKSEAMIGYFTKYGDGGVDLLPIVDLYKHEVRALARTLGVPNPVITKAPSAGLWPGQTDEGEIGLSYDELDAALAAIAAGKTASLPAATTERVQRLIETSEHKRRPVPAFRRDERLDPTV